MLCCKQLEGDRARLSQVSLRVRNAKPVAAPPPVLSVVDKKRLLQSMRDDGGMDTTTAMKSPWTGSANRAAVGNDERPWKKPSKNVSELGRCVLSCHVKWRSYMHATHPPYSIEYAVAT